MNLMKSASRFLKKNGGTILAIGASVGVVLTAIETGKASIKAENLKQKTDDGLEVYYLSVACSAVIIS